MPNIESKISLAREASLKHRKFIGFIVVAILGLIGMSALFWLSDRFKFSENKPIVVNNEPTDQPTIAVTTSGAERDSFLQQLKIFQDELEPALDAASAGEWAAEQYAKTMRYKDEALAAFAAGKYVSALGLLQIATDVAKEILADSERQFQNDLAAAIAAFNREDQVSAKALIESALLFKPEAPTALAYQVRIGLLPEVLPLLKRAEQARRENDPEVELAQLKEIIRLDPARQELAARHQALTVQIREHRFTDYINQGMQAVRRDDLTVAQKFSQQAKKIDPKRPELVLLRQNIDQLDQQLAKQNYLRQAQQAVAQDNWVQAYHFYQQAKVLDSADAVAVDGEKLAGQMIKAHEQLSFYLAQPQRLASSNIAVAARASLKETETLNRQSPGLEQKSRKLIALLDGYRGSVSVTILSDNKTNISVRRVGQIGKTLKKIISLKPGSYRFEGKRKGYRSKLIEVQVRPDSQSQVVTLVCDEPI